MIMADVSLHREWLNDLCSRGQLTKKLVKLLVSNFLVNFCPSLDLCGFDIAEGRIPDDEG